MSRHQQIHICTNCSHPCDVDDTRCVMWFGNQIMEIWCRGCREILLSDERDNEQLQYETETAKGN